MILALLLFGLTPRGDSLEAVFARDARIEDLIELSRYYVAGAEYRKALEVLKTHERRFTQGADRARLMYETGSVYMFAGDIAKAHETLLRLLGTFPALEIANDAAERVYLLEAARDDTVELRRLINVVRLFETGQHGAAADSARVLLGTSVGPHACYYLARAYEATGEMGLALSALEELDRAYPEHAIHEAVLLRADILAGMGKTEDAVEILEQAIVRAPDTIYALKARQRLAALRPGGDEETRP